MINNKINIENYEEYILDYLEGNLDEGLLLDFEIFLVNNPSIASEVENLLDYSLPSNSINVPDQNCLKKNLDSLPSTSITIENFDERYLEYIEGNATESQQEELRVFMENNPSKNIDAKIISSTILVADKSIIFERKQELRVMEVGTSTIIDDLNFEEFCVANSEGILDEESYNQLNAFIAGDKAKQKTFELYSRLVLTPNNSIVFEGKQKLKKSAIVIGFYPRVAKIASIAAILVVVFGIALKINNNRVDEIQTKRIVRDAMAKLSIDVKNHANEPTEVASIEKINIAKPIGRLKETIKKVEPKVNTLAADLGGEPEMKMPTIFVCNQLPQNDNHDGYYSVTLSNDNFVTRNKDLKVKSIGKLRDFFGINPDRLNVPEDKLTMWDMAEVGVSMFNSLTESNVLITRTSANQNK